MTIKNILTEITNASHPIARVLHKGLHSKCLIIGFKKGMKLKDHAAPLSSKLLVLQGAVIYTEGLQKKN
jgi:quercetin dioxygenase-like cupin family protein